MSNLQKLIDLPLEELFARMKQSGSKAAVLRSLGVAEQDGRARKIIRDRLGEAGESKRLPTHTAETIKNAFASSSCWSDVYRYLGVSLSGYNKKAILSSAVVHGIPIPDFKISGTFQRGKNNIYTKEDIFKERSTYTRSSLRIAVERFGILGEKKCSTCNLGDPCTLR